MLANIQALHILLPYQKFIKSELCLALSYRYDDFFSLIFWTLTDQVAVGFLTSLQCSYSILYL